MNVLEFLLSQETSLEGLLRMAGRNAGVPGLPTRPTTLSQPREASPRIKTPSRRESEKPAGKYRENIARKDRGALQPVSQMDVSLSLSYWPFSSGENLETSFTAIAETEGSVQIFNTFCAVDYSVAPRMLLDEGLNF